MATISDVFLGSEGSEDSMDVAHVFANYLSIFGGDCSRLPDHVCSTTVLDWFGRSFRGQHNILQHFRCDVLSQYEHVNFEKVVECEPIEERPVHTSTMALPKDNKRFINPRNKVTVNTLRTYADSDLECDTVLDMPNILEMDTPEKEVDPLAGTCTPPNSTEKPEVISLIDSDEDDNDVVESQPKRAKHTNSPTTKFSFLRHIPTNKALSERRAIQHFGIRTLADDSSSEDEATEAIKNLIEYTSLRYLEVTGVLRKRLPTETANMPGIALIDTPKGIGPEDQIIDCRVRIKISYRTRLYDEQLQFALIIYEHINRSTTSHTRRNLMLEFNKLDNDTDDETNEFTEQNNALTNPLNSAEKATVSSVDTSTNAEVAGSLETAPFPFMRTPTKVIYTPPPTPKRKPRPVRQTPEEPRLSGSTMSKPKLGAARSLRL